MNITRNIPLSQIAANPYQPRNVFAEEPLAELAASIKANGLIQPVIVRKAGRGYEIIAGERRCRAAQLAGLAQVPCLVISADDREAARLALVENIQRADLNALEEAKAYRQLLELDGCTQSELASRVGRKQSTIANKIRLLGLAPAVQGELAAGKLTERQARALLALPAERQELAAAKIIASGMDSLAAERYAASLLGPKLPKKSGGADKVFLKDARIAVNTITAAVGAIRRTNLEVTQQVTEESDGYTVTISIRKPE